MGQLLEGEKKGRPARGRGPGQTHTGRYPSEAGPRRRLCSLIFIHRPLPPGEGLFYFQVTVIDDPGGAGILSLPSQHCRQH